MAWAPLPIFADHLSAPTVNVLTDGVDPDRLFGGVATAMVVGDFAARRLRARLRLVPVTFPPIQPRWETSCGRIAWIGTARRTSFTCHPAIIDLCRSATRM